MAVVEIKENEFDEVVLKSDKPVFVDFYARAALRGEAGCTIC